MKNLEDAAQFPSENPNPVLRVTKNKVLYVNKAGERLFSIKEGDKIPKFFQSELTEALNANILKTFEVEIDDLSYILDFSPIKEEGYVNIYGKDITECKQIELDLKHKKSELESIFSAAPTGIGVVVNRVIKQVNDRFCELVGYTREELLNKSARMVYPSDEDYEYVGKEKYAQIEVSGSGTVDTRFKRKDGKIINILLSSVLIDPDQPSMGAAVTALDITDRKIAEQKLRESEEKYRYFFNNAQVGLFWSKISDGKFLECNDTFAKLVGYDTREECLADYIAFEHYMNLKDWDEMLEEIRINNEIKDFEIQVTKRDGTPYWASISARVDLKENRIEGAATDITERKNIELKLKESETKYRELFNNIDSGVAIYEAINNSEDFIFKEFNFAGQKIDNIIKEDLIGKRVTEIFPGIKDFGLFDVFQRVWKTGKPEHHPIAHYEDKRIEGWRENYIYKLHSGEIVTVYSDLSEKKKVEQKLKESERKYRLIFENANDAISILDLEGNFYEVNDLYCSRLGYTREEILKSNIRDINVPDYAELVSNRILEIGKIGFKVFESAHKAKDGSIIPVEISSKSILYEKKPAILNIVRDITERKFAEIELQKSEATYREAYNRAEFYKDIFTHDINNILQNISNGIQLNEMYLNKPDKANAIKRNIDMVKRQVRRGANLVSNVRKLSKISESETILFSVNCCEVLKKAINYIKNAFQDKNIKIMAQFTEDNFEILANELLEDVFENILTNSINYNGSEVISIQVKINREMRKGINYIKMQFIDNGIGITDERKYQIFIRGYSEELSVHGMGLGLSLVKKIIYSYNGEIWMEDRIKGDYTKGNNCIVLLPEMINNG